MATKKRIVAPAIREKKTGIVMEAPSKAWAHDMIEAAEHIPDKKVKRGFITNEDKFVKRKEAAKIFKKQGFEYKLGTKVTGAEVGKSGVTLTVEPAAGGEAEREDRERACASPLEPVHDRGGDREEAGQRATDRHGQEGDVEAGHGVDAREDKEAGGEDQRAHDAVREQPVDPLGERPLIAGHDRSTNTTVLCVTNNLDTQIVRIEQIYPFATDALAKRIERMTNLEDVVWCQ